MHKKLAAVYRPSFEKAALQPERGIIYISLVGFLNANDMMIYKNTIIHYKSTLPYYIRGGKYALTATLLFHLNLHL